MFVFTWLFMLLARLVLIAAGLVVVPLALPFAGWGHSVDDRRYIRVLPRWAWLWSNDFDGSLGDKRGWWDAHAPFGLGASHWFSQFWWLAIRNPVNNLRRTAWGSCPVSECLIWYSGLRDVADKPGQYGWQLVTAVHRTTGKKWRGFYLAWELTPHRAFVVRLGFKIAPRHENSGEPPKGFTFKINPWKAV